MNTYGITDKTYQMLLDTFSKFPEIKEVLIFGSRAKGNYKNGSDIDLAVKGGEVGPCLIFRLKSLFNSRLSIPYKVDVVGYDYLEHQGLKEHVDRIGRVIYKSDKKSIAIKS